MRPQPAQDFGADPLVALLPDCPLRGRTRGRRDHRRPPPCSRSVSFDAVCRPVGTRTGGIPISALIRRKAFRTVTPADVARPVDRLPKLLGAARNAARLVFVNGGFRADLSSLDMLPAGISVAPLASDDGREPGDEMLARAFRTPAKPASTIRLLH